MLCQYGNSFRDVVIVAVQWFGGSEVQRFKGSGVQRISVAAGRERPVKSKKKLMNIKPTGGGL